MEDEFTQYIKEEKTSRPHQTQWFLLMNKVAEYTEKGLLYWLTLTETSYICHVQHFCFVFEHDKVVGLKSLTVIRDRKSDRMSTFKADKIGMRLFFAIVAAPKEVRTIDTIGSPEKWLEELSAIIGE